jgi:hypothetical protein
MLLHFYRTILHQIKCHQIKFHQKKAYRGSHRVLKKLTENLKVLGSHLSPRNLRILMLLHFHSTTFNQIKFHCIKLCQMKAYRGSHWSSAVEFKKNEHKTKRSWVRTPARETSESLCYSIFIEQPFMKLSFLSLSRIFRKKGFFLTNRCISCSKLSNRIFSIF